VTDLNLFYKAQPALHQIDFDPAGFEWIDAADDKHSVLSFIRKGQSTDDMIVVVLNFTPETHFNYDVGIPLAGNWKEMLNSDATKYGGSGKGNPNPLTASNRGRHGRPDSLTLTIPPLAVIFLKHA
jgi:1,4-alpha-glucan branching enzyme